MNYYKLVKALFSVIVAIWVILFALGFTILADYCLGSSAFTLVALLLGMIVGVLSGSYLYVVLTIPALLIKEFDVIKNKVAMNEFASVDDFQSDVANFLIGFFRFPGMTVSGGLFRFKGCKPLEISSKANYAELADMSMDIKIFKQKGSSIIYVPIIMGGEFLGDFYLEVNTLSTRIFKCIITDFENLLLDDLLKIVILLRK